MSKIMFHYQNNRNDRKAKVNLFINNQTAHYPELFRQKQNRKKKERETSGQEVLCKIVKSVTVCLLNADTFMDDIAETGLH